jgi:hypothetical protein
MVVQIQSFCLQSLKRPISFTLNRKNIVLEILLALQIEQKSYLLLARYILSSFDHSPIKCII